MAVASCGSLSALTLGLPSAAAVGESKGTLPPQMFYAAAPVSSKLRQRFTTDIGGIHMLAVLTPANIGVTQGSRIKEILILALDVRGQAIPTEIIEHIARMRASGMLFVCVRHRPEADSSAPSPSNGASRTSPDGRGEEEECALAVLRTLPGRAGHIAQVRVFSGAWQPVRDMRLVLKDPGNPAGDMDGVWDTLSAQAILGSIDGGNIDERLALRERTRLLQAQEEKLARDHARAKNPNQRNELYAKLHKVRTELAGITGDRKSPSGPEPRRD